jgi:hypothetical protein
MKSSTHETILTEFQTWKALLEGEIATMEVRQQRESAELREQIRDLQTITYQQRLHIRHMEDELQNLAAENKALQHKLGLFFVAENAAASAASESDHEDFIL